jgi:hypothetical protein
MFGTRGIWKDGWHAASVHAPFSRHGNYGEDKWKLYHLETD